MTFWRWRKQAQQEHVEVEAVLAENRRELIDMATRLVRLEADVEIYRPFYVDDQRIEAS